MCRELHRVEADIEQRAAAELGREQTMRGINGALKPNDASTNFRSPTAPLATSRRSSAYAGRKRLQIASIREALVLPGGVGHPRRLLVR